MPVASVPAIVTLVPARPVTVTGHRAGAVSLAVLVLGQLVQGAGPAQQLPGLPASLLSVDELSHPLQVQVGLGGGQCEHPLLDVTVLKAPHDHVTAEFVRVRHVLVAPLCCAFHCELTHLGLALHSADEFGGRLLWLLTQVEELHHVDELVLGADAAPFEHDEQIILRGVLVGPGIVTLSAQLLGSTGP